MNIELASETAGQIGKLARITFRPEVLSELGFFGGLFELGEYRRPVLVSSIDGVGTKLKIALTVNRHDNIGRDIVNHCVNDIFTCGAEPLFFLDYIATGKLMPERAVEVVRGMAAACRENGCALIGGETAEMPGVYAVGDYDVAGCIVGVVEKDAIIRGQAIRAGDAVVGIPSSGLHTNGYSLVRKIFNPEQLKAYDAELGCTLGEALLEPHRSYYPVLKPLLPHIKGMAHITGGGLVDNIPRVLPVGMGVRLDKKSWQVPPLFQMVQKRGKVSDDEMYRVYNMGIGMAVCCGPEDADRFLVEIPGAAVIGEVVADAGKNPVIIK